MYQEPKKIGKSKLIEIIILILLIIWAVIFIFNYLRYINDKSLIFAIHSIHEYEDGYVDEYSSLGYITRYYKRESISRKELVPFWVLRENPTNNLGLPEVPKGYDVPKNPRREDKFRGLLYYYERGSELLGTYKCINTAMDCNKATSGYDSYNIVNKDPLTALSKQHTLGIIHSKFAFVDDSYAQNSVYGDSTYERIIYLYQFIDEDPVILAKFADVKESTYDENYELAYGDNNKYIVKSMDNSKWGIIEIKESGNIEEVLPYEYDSINYDVDTNYYILCKNGKWYIYDLYRDEVLSKESDDPIYDVWRNSNLTYYYKTGKDRSSEKKTRVDYKIYRLDGTQFLTINNVIEIVERPKYIMYLTDNDNVIHFIDYSREEKHTLQLSFSELWYDELSNPAFKIRRETENSITLDIYETNQLSSVYDTFTVNTRIWNN